MGVGEKGSNLVDHEPGCTLALAVHTAVFPCGRISLCVQGDVRIGADGPQSWHCSACSQETISLIDLDTIHRER